jgi:meso-butanediol dehydrogenase/(S,S)-butanediol dehydrogenase/diacetyl reductase
MNHCYPELNGKVAVVTGAGRPNGLGAAIAVRLGLEGASVVIHDLGKSKGEFAEASHVGLGEEMEAVAQSVRDAGGKANVFHGDMLVEDDVEALIGHAVSSFGRIDILINNAGVGFLFGPLVEMTQAQWDAVQGVNLRGCFFAMKHAARQMMRQDSVEGWGRGRIVSIASRAAKSGSAWTSAYTASKHGLVGLTRSAAIEFGPHAITVNAVCPNHVTTGLGAWQNDFMSKARGQTVEEYLGAMRARIPLGRLGTAADTANACAFLCSSQAGFITGEAMNVSGGDEYH